MTASKTPATTEQIMNSIEFKELIAARRKLSVSITVLSIVTYFVFILLVAFDPAFLGKTIGESKVSIGIYAGLGLLVFSFLLTGIYQKVSDGRIAELQKRLRNTY